MGEVGEFMAAGATVWPGVTPFSTQFPEGLC